MTEVVRIRLEKEVKLAVQKIAQEESRSFAQQINVACKEHIRSRQNEHERDT